MTDFNSLLGIDEPIKKEEREKTRVPSPNAAMYRRKYLRSKKYSLVKLLLKNARRRAKQKNMEFSITPDDVKMPEFCPILGIRLESAFGGKALDNSPSLDRIDSNLGYVPGNVWIISFRANTIKNNATVEELQKLVDVLCKMKKQNT